MSNPQPLIHYKPLSDWSSGFSEWVIRRHPLSDKQQNGFMGGFVFGERGDGKSTYCYKTSSKTYYELNGYSKKDDEEYAYKLALDTLFFDPTDFRKFLIYNKLKKIITPMCILDDASMHFGKLLHQTNPRLYSALLGETATIRTAVTGFLITAPKRAHVAKFLRDYDDFKGEVKTDSGPSNKNMQTWNRKVRFYKWNMYPDETKFRITIPFQDKYSCYIPQPYYGWYVKKKHYFEIKHEIEIADVIDPEIRIIFIENEKDLPSYPNQPDLKEIIKRWKNESEEEQERIKEKKREQKLRKASTALRMKKMYEKLEKIKDTAIYLEDKDF